MQNLQALNLSICDNRSKLSETGLYWYDFVVEVQALPKVTSSVFNQKVLRDWYEACIKPVTPEDRQELNTLVHQSQFMLLQTDHLLDIDLDRPFNASAINLNEKTLATLESDGNAVFAVILQLILNYQNDGDFFKTKALPSTLEIINRLPMLLAFYLFRVMVQVISKNKQGIFQLVALLVYAESNELRNSLFEALRSYYSWLLSLQFNAAKNGITQS